MKSCLTYIILPIVLVILMIIGGFFVYIWLNPSPVKHEAGRDTKEFYGDGSFQIFKSPLALRDLERKVTLENPIYSYRESNGILYVYGETGYTVVNIKEETVKQYILSEKIRGPNWQKEVRENYGDKYVRLNSFEEFTEEEKTIFNSLNKTSGK